SRTWLTAETEPFWARLSAGLIDSWRFFRLAHPEELARICLRPHSREPVHSDPVLLQVRCRPLIEDCGSPGGTALWFVQLARSPTACASDPALRIQRPSTAGLHSRRSYRFGLAFLRACAGVLRFC